MRYTHGLVKATNHCSQALYIVLLSSHQVTIWTSCRSFVIDISRFVIATHRMKKGVSLQAHCAFLKGVHMNLASLLHDKAQRRRLQTFAISRELLAHSVYTGNIDYIVTQCIQ